MRIEIGTIKRAADLGLSSYGRHKMIWAACSGCAAERWTLSRQGVPVYPNCQHCSMTPAETYAHSVIAAARAFGDCPIAALTSPASQKRRSLAPAAYAVSNATGRQLKVSCATLGVRLDSTQRAFSAAAKPWPTASAKTWRGAWMAALNSIRRPG